MRGRLGVFVLFVAAAVGCGGGGACGTPEATFEAYKLAVIERDFEAVWEMLSTSSRERIECDAKDMAAECRGLGKAELERRARSMGLTAEQMKSIDGRDLFVTVCRLSLEDDTEGWERFARTRLSRVELDGETARVHVRLGAGVETASMTFVCEDANWKIDLAGSKSGLAGGKRE